MGWNGHADDSTQAAQGLLARAKAGDFAAAQQLRQAAQTWAPNHRNAAIDAENQMLPPGAQMGHIKNPHHGVAGAIGGALHTLAPLAAFIPGVGPIAAGAIAAGASGLGGAMDGGGVDVGGMLKSGLAAGLGKKLMGGGDKLPQAPEIGSSAGVPGVSSSTISAPGNITQAGSGGSTPVQASAVPSLTAPTAQSQGFLGQLGASLHDPKTGNWDFTKLAGLGTGALDIMGKRSQRQSQERYMNSALDLRRGQIAQGQQAYDEKAGIRQQALAKLSKMQGSSIFGGGY